MKPISLKFAAFGSYRDEVSIDFGRFGDHGIYLIAGDTGSGKTTIFDAISYALYAEASAGKERRAGKSFRSDYASPDTRTFVEFRFMCRGEVWRVKRMLEHQKPKKDGTFTAIPATSYLLNEARETEWNGVNEVNAKIRELIGLTQDQFCRTMMIAQGEFLKIINAKSNERKDLFQKLFGTERFEAFQARLKDEYLRFEAQNKELETKIMANVSNIARGDDETASLDFAYYSADVKYASIVLNLLAGLIHRQSEKRNELAAIKADLSARHIGHVKLIEEARSVNKKFQDLRTAKAEQAIIVSAKSEFDDKQAQLNLARAALPLINAERTINGYKSELSDSISKLGKAETEKAKTEALLPEAEKAHNETVEAAKRSDDMLVKAERISDGVRLLVRLADAKEDLKKSENKLSRLALKSADMGKTYSDAKLSYYMNQAGALAKELKDGCPCPVCGSLNHPAPAQVTSSTLSIEQLDNIEARWRMSEQEYQMQKNDVRYAQENINNLLSELELKGVAPDSDAETMRQNAVNLRNAAQMLKDAAQKAQDDVNSVKLRCAEAAATINALKKRIETLKATLNDEIKLFETELTKRGFASAEEMRKNALSEIEINRLDKQIIAYKQSLAAINDRTDRLTNELIGKQESDLNALSEQLKHLEAELYKADSNLKGIQTLLDRNELAHKNISELLAIQNSQREYRTLLNDMYRTVSGQKQGTVKESFEIYVQRFYFRSVVAKANSRLNKLTDGMFTLRVKDSADKLNGKSGLDLDVLDLRTGLWRDVSTLSGGESFMASLALALGLSDMVQAQNGGISLDALFIDEGFGTLDENALSNALDMLASLAEGKRLIGVISHMNELERRIPKQIRVIKTQLGSKINIIDF